MKLLDVSAPGKRRKRVLNVPGFGWMAVVKADLFWNASGGQLHNDVRANQA